MNLEALKSFVAEIFVRLGVPEAPARLSAAALVAADVEGMPAHGLRLVPVYVERILAGSVSTDTEPKLVHDGGSAMVIDANNMLGQLSSDWAIPMVSERAREHGLACIAVRNAAHFGSARFWARQIAEGGLVGLALANGRPLKSAAAAAFALPSSGAQPYVVDFQANGVAADPAEAIARMLLPADPKRTLRLATAVELLCAGLAGGALGAELGAFEGDSARPSGASQLFLALDPARFGVADLPERVASHAPSNPAAAPRPCHEEFAVAPELLAKLNACAARVGVERTLE
jgi:LDH2 family malate/lactate/ureidoglycolate dehydrogenase